MTPKRNGPTAGKIEILKEAMIMAMTMVIGFPYQRLDCCLLGSLWLAESIRFRPGIWGRLMI